MQKNNNYAKVPTLGLGQNLAYGFPDKLLSKMRYHEVGTLASTAGTIAKYLFRWNSIFDPDFTGVGHQPLYRDTFAGIYDHYAVISCVAKITLVNSSSNPHIVGSVTDDDNSVSANRDTLCEQSHGKHYFIPALTGSLSSKTWNMTWDAKTYLNIDPFTSESYKTLVANNPTEESFLHIWSVPADGSSTSSVLFDIELIYTVLFTELQTPVQS